MSFMSFIHITSHRVNAMALYLAFDVLVTTCCLLDFHEMGDLPSKIQKPYVELLVLGNPTQSL
ncbi:hypothetical protein BVRB_5g111880 [Beta vulgaris subsp. vulgaris]|nr:hypothetical protein BVRB_5g111880 [Beta vulgaris subsp. vulgaris]